MMTHPDAVRVDDSSRGSAYTVSAREKRDDYTVFEAFANEILIACKQSALGTCMISEMRRFVEVLETYRPIADFKIKDIFKYSKGDEGMPKSIILQKERLEQLEK